MKKLIISALLIMAFSGLASGAQEDASDLISLDLKGMDIRDVLKILSQKSGLNIVADNDIKGSVTVYIKDVSVMSALDIITSINNLAYEQEAGLIRVMRNIEYEKTYGSRFKDKMKTEVIKLNYANASEVTKVVGEMKTAKGKVVSDDASNTVVLIDMPQSIEKMRSVISGMDAPMATEVFSLDYARAEQIKDKLEQMITKGAGSIRFDERTNKVVIKDTLHKIGEIKKVIEAFDEKTREVVIDASIIQVTLLDKYSYGIDWLDIAKLGNVKFTADTNLSSGLSNVTPNTLTIATVGGKYTEVISMLKTFGKTNVLSRPRITVADRQEAKILVGAKEVYVTSNITTTSGGTYNTSDNIQFVDVGVRLSVTPQINKLGFVTLKIKPEVSSADATKTVTLKNPDLSTRAVVPYVTTSEAETTVLVKDNTTIIIGGLMKDTLVSNRQKVPLLGDIPLVGKLFSTKGESKEKTELVVFLTPHIIEGDSTAEETKKYMADWDKKLVEMNIGEPEETEMDMSRLMPEKKAPARVKAGQVQGKQKPVVKNKQPKKQKPSDSSITKTPYEEYYLAIRQEINDLAKMDKDISGIKGEVQLALELDRDGFLVRSPVVLNNPDLRLVRSAVRSVKKALPFQRFPKGLDNDHAEFNVVIRYE
jgi:MSHA biogenesis protein MshL